MKFTANGVAFEAKSVLGAKQKACKMLFTGDIKGIGYRNNYVDLYDFNNNLIATRYNIYNAWITN